MHDRSLVGSDHQVVRDHAAVEVELATFLETNEESPAARVDEEGSVAATERAHAISRRRSRRAGLPRTAPPPSGDPRGAAASAPGSGPGPDRTRRTAPSWAVRTPRTA